MLASNISGFRMQTIFSVAAANPADVFLFQLSHQQGVHISTDVQGEDEYFSSAKSTRDLIQYTQFVFLSGHISIPREMAEKRMELPSKAFSPPHSHDNLISSPDLDSDGEELPPAYREEFEFRDEVSIFRDQAYLDEKEYLELCDTKEREQYAAEVSAPPAGADSDGPSASDDEMLNEALKFARRQPTIRRSSNGLLPKLQKPVVVPQIRNGVGVPFARAFSEALKAYDVTEEEWLAFIDNLNVVATANPPLQVLDLAGNIVGFL